MNYTGNFCGTPEIREKTNVNQVAMFTIVTNGNEMKTRWTVINKTIKQNRLFLLRIGS